MKSTGIVRKIDQLGRVVLPVELRNTLNIEKDDTLEFFVNGNTLVLRKYEPGCLFCGETQNVSTFQEKQICQKCKSALKPSK